MQIAITIIFVITIIYSVWFLSGKKKLSVQQPVIATEKDLAAILFYQKLATAEKEIFLNEANIFLQKVIITAVNTNITDADKILVAASAVIPMFAFKGWEYPHLDEVLL